MTTLVGSKPHRLSPYKLAPRILCKACKAKEFPKGELGQHLPWKHSAEALSVAKQFVDGEHGTEGIEVPVNGGRIDHQPLKNKSLIEGGFEFATNIMLVVRDEVQCTAASKPVMKPMKHTFIRIWGGEQLRDREVTKYVHWFER
jgi:hypothetical protein